MPLQISGEVNSIMVVTSPKNPKIPFNVELVTAFNDFLASKL